MHQQPREDQEDDMRQPLNGREAVEISAKNCVEETGGFGWYQKLLCFVLFSLFEIVTMLLWGTYLFQTFPIYKCTNIASGATYECSVEDFCANKEGVHAEINWEDNRSLRNWIVEFDLACAPRWMIGMQGSSYFIGFVISSFTFLPLSDFLGRKKTLIISFLMHIVFLGGGLLVTGFNHYWLFNVFLFITGAGAAGYFLVGFYYNLESVPERYAVSVGSSLRAYNSLSPLIASFFFVFISSDWRMLQMTKLGCTILLLIPLFFYFVESPRYLLGKGQNEEAVKVLNHIASCNGEKNRISVDQIKSGHARALSKKEQWELISGNPEVKRRIIVMAMCWFITVFCYYIMNFYVKYASPDLWTNAIFAGLAFFSGCVFGGGIVNKIGLKYAFTSCFAFSSVMGYLMVFFSENQLAQQIFLFLTTLGISACYNTCYLSNHQLFPAEIKGTCAGITSTCGRFAGIFAPMIVELPRPWPMVFFSTACVFGFIVIQIGLRHEDSIHHPKHNQ
jgi:OCT family organic cation transporter-like MFS transporter 4/5